MKLHLLLKLQESLWSHCLCSSKSRMVCFSIYMARNYSVKMVPQLPMCIYSVGIENHEQSTVHDTMIKHKVTTTILGFQWGTFYELCTETPAQRTPGSCRNTDACLSRCLGHLLFPYSSIAEVCKGPHMFHPILRQGSTMCLKSPNLNQQ